MIEPVHFTRLKLMAQSAAHYQGATFEDSDFLLKGSGVHSLVLGGRPVVEYPERRYGKAWDAFKLEHENDIILPTKSYDEAHRIADAVLANRIAMALLADAEHELDLEWTMDSRACAGRLDSLGTHALTDLKTTRCSQPGWFIREAVRRAYHAQLAWYRQGAWLARQKAPGACYIIAAETSSPYPVTVFEVVPRALEQGMRLWRLWWEQLRVCEETDIWPAYTEAVVELDVPDEMDVEWDVLEEVA